MAIQNNSNVDKNSEQKSEYNSKQNSDQNLNQNTDKNSMDESNTLTTATASFQDYISQKEQELRRQIGGKTNSNNPNNFNSNQKPNSRQRQGANFGNSFGNNKWQSDAKTVNRSGFRAGYSKELEDDSDDFDNDPRENQRGGQSRYNSQNQDRNKYDNRFENQYENHSGHQLVIAGFVFCLIAIGVLGYYNYQDGKSVKNVVDSVAGNFSGENNSGNSNNNSGGMVAGVSTDIENNSSANNQNLVSASNKPQVITGANFSIVSRGNVPVGFEKKSQKTGFEYLGTTEPVATSSSYLFDIDFEGKKLSSGIKIASLEYDNKLSQSDFDQRVLTVLNAKFGSGFNSENQQGWQISGLGIELPAGVKATKIEYPGNKNSSVFYSIVTSSNYYVIEVINQTTVSSDLSSISSFTSSIITDLYLN